MRLVARVDDVYDMRCDAVVLPLRLTTGELVLQLFQEVSECRRIPLYKHNQFQFDA